MTAHFISAPEATPSYDLLAEIGLTGDATHIAAAVLALAAVKIFF